MSVKAYICYTRNSNQQRTHEAEGMLEIRSIRSCMACSVCRCGCWHRLLTAILICFFSFRQWIHFMDIFLFISLWSVKFSVRISLPMGKFSKSVLNKCSPIDIFMNSKHTPIFFIYCYIMIIYEWNSWSYFYQHIRTQMRTMRTLSWRN